MGMLCLADSTPAGELPLLPPTSYIPNVLKCFTFTCNFHKINDMLLFFKAQYRDPILRGEKTETVRGPKRLPRVGSVVQACVGPSRIFARLLIEAVEPVTSLADWRAAQVRACYAGEIPSDAVLLRFRRVDITGNNPA